MSDAEWVSLIYLFGMKNFWLHFKPVFQDAFDDCIGEEKPV